MQMWNAMRHNDQWTAPYVRTWHGEDTRLFMWHLWPMVFAAWFVFMLGMMLGMKSVMMKKRMMMMSKMGMGGQGMGMGMMRGKHGMGMGMMGPQGMPHHHHHGYGMTECCCGEDEKSEKGQHEEEQQVIRG